MLTRLVRGAGELCLRAPRGAWACVALAWMAAIWWLSSLEAGPGARAFWMVWLLNCGHAFEFGMLALWLALALPRRAAPRPWADLTSARIVAVSVLVLGWAVLDEWHQSNVRGRDATPFDLVTDACGCLGVLLVARRAGENARLERLLVVVLIICMLAGLAATLH
ncbi:MAG: hypothetical protein FJ299_08615 [Planctomycetes bacterium]|nr:hypothetical protein [Planctomycetota bacterium]